MIMTDDNLLQDVRDLTQNLDFNTSRYNHTAPSITFIFPKLTRDLVEVSQAQKNTTVKSSTSQSEPGLARSWFNRLDLLRIMTVH